MARITSFLLPLLILAGIGITAQAQEFDMLVVNVPFSFSVNGTKLPAGTYALRRNSPTDPTTMTIQSTDGRYSSYLIGNVEESANSRLADSRLVFDVIDGEHYLRVVGTNFGVHTLLRSHAEADASHHAIAGAAGSGK